MPSNYTGISSNVTAGNKLTVALPIDGDADNGATFQVPLQTSADFSAYVYEQLQAFQLTNLTDNGVVNAMTTINDLAWASSLGLWVAVGAGGLISTSPDGKTWTAQTANVGTTGLLSVVWNGTIFVAVGGALSAGAGAAAVTTSTNGTTWVAQASNSGVGFGFNGVAYDATLGLFCAAGGTFVCTSPNGTTWTKVSVGSTSMGAVAANGAGTFLVVGTDGTHNAWTSTNGTTWTSQTIAGLSTNCIGVTYSAPLSCFMVLDNSATAKSATSTSSSGTAWNAAISTAVPSGSFSTAQTLLKWTGRAFLLNISSSNKTTQYSVLGTAWRGHITPPFSGGATVQFGSGVNSDTGQVLIAASVAGAAHTFSTLLMPNL